VRLQGHVASRLEAQKRLMPDQPWRWKAVTERESADLLRLSPDLSDDEKRARLLAASERAHDIYGPDLAPRVMADAMSFYLKGEKEADLKGEIIAAMLAKGSSVTSLFNQPGYGNPAQGEGWPWSAPEPQASAELTEGNAADRARAQADQFLSGQTPRIQEDAALHGIQHNEKEPTDAQKRYVIDNPDSWQVNDSMVKPGTAAKILAEARRPPAKTPRTAMQSLPTAD
jgi:hypothetical protein